MKGDILKRVNQKSRLKIKLRRECSSQRNEVRPFCADLGLGLLAARRAGSPTKKIKELRLVIFKIRYSQIKGIGEELERIVGHKPGTVFKDIYNHCSHCGAFGRVIADKDDLTICEDCVARQIVS